MIKINEIILYDSFAEINELHKTLKEKYTILSANDFIDYCMINSEDISGKINQVH